MEGPRTSPTPRDNPWLTASAILGVSLVVYWPALGGARVWDDDAHITRPGLQSLGGLWRIWTDFHATQQYYPLLHSAFWLEHIAWGDATVGYHLANVLLHALCAFLLVLILQRLGVPGARLAGILFAVHPVCVESVAWISEQKNTLSLAFYLLSAMAYLRFDRERGTAHAARAYGLATALFVMALLTKSVTATLPGALLVVLWWERGALSWRRDAAPLVPWFAAAAASGLLTSWVERTIGGAQGAAFDLTLVERCLLAGRALWFYLGKLLWPSPLALIYPRWDVRAQAGGWAPYLAAALALTVVLWLVRRRSRGPLAAWLLFAGTLFPALGFFNVYPFLFSYVADHFQYQATLGIIAAASAGLAILIGRAAPGLQALGWALAASGVAVLALVANAQSGTFLDARTLFQATLAENPDCWMARDGLGVWYRDHGDPGKAVTQFQEALRSRPGYPQAHNNLGLCYGDRGEADRAIAEFREAIRLKPDLAEAHNNLGAALAARPGRSAEAIAEFREAVRLQPEFVAARNNLGTAFLKEPGHLGEAIAQYEEAVRLRPDLPESHANLGDAYSESRDRLNDAIAEYGEALRLNPGSAEVRNNLGLALNAQGRPEEAVEQYKEAIRLMPGFAEIRLNLAIALLGVPDGRNEAFRQVEAYLQVRPPNDTTRQILAQIQGNP